MTTTTQPKTDQSFLEAVARHGHLTSLYEAQEMAEVVFRTMRDLLDANAIDQIAAELDQPAHATDNKTLQASIADLWQDSNPVVGWLSRLRPPFAKQAPQGIDDRLFFTRVRREGGMPKTTTAPTVVKAVFAATKGKLSNECIQTIDASLPGKVRTLWASV